MSTTPYALVEKDSFYFENDSFYFENDSFYFKNDSFFLLPPPARPCGSILPVL